MKALIVEDDPIMARLLSVMLTTSNFAEPVVAESPEAAFRLLRLDDPTGPPGEPEIIFMDIQLGGIDGIEACARIKSDQRYADVPVIMVTSASQTDDLEMAFVAGAVDYIIKPPHYRELLARARSAIRLKQELDRQRALGETAKALRERIAELEESLGAHLAVDPVTGLPVRGALRKVACRHFDAEPSAATSSARHAVVIVKVDAFDNYVMFHQEAPADALLARVASALTDVNARAGDLLVRSGRDSFALLMPNVREDVARQTAERLRRAVFELTIPHEYSPVDSVVTASVGVAESGAHGKGHHATVIAGAEHAVARAIDRGGNRIELTAGAHPPPT